MIFVARLYIFLLGVLIVKCENQSTSQIASSHVGYDDSKLLDKKPPISIGRSKDESADNSDTTTDASSLEEYDEPSKVIHKFHDLYMHYKSPHRVVFGHLESKPTSFEKRLESINKGKHYKGEIVWHDGTGGYGAYRWNLAQGRL